MKKIGCLLALVGLVMGVISAVLFWSVVTRVVAANEVKVVDLTIGVKTTTPPIEVDTSRACQVTIAVKFATTSMEEKKFGSRTQRELRYAFPYACRVLDAEGKELHAEKGKLEWNQGTRITTDKRITPTGGSGTIRHNLGKFDVAPPGKIVVEAEVKPDTDYQAELKAARVAIYDKVSRHGSSIGGGIILLLGSPLVVIIGIILFIIGLAKGSKPAAPPQSYDPGPPQRGQSSA